LHIPGVGQLQITPGGTDLAELAREENELLAVHQALLQRVGVASLSEAELRYASHQQQFQNTTPLNRMALTLAPSRDHVS